jgi:hypothetical protein
MPQIGVQRINQREITEAQDSHKDLQDAFAFHDDPLKATHLPERTSLLIGNSNHYAPGAPRQLSKSGHDAHDPES